MVEIVSPFPEEQLALAWKWHQEFPLANFDDYSPRTLENSLVEMRERMRVERTWVILKDGQACGIVAYRPATPRLGSFHICFAKGHCSREEKRKAFRSILEELFALGVEKLCAVYFVDNQHIARFLRDFGAVREGRLRRQTVRNGVPVDMIQIAIFKGDRKLCRG